ncbi:hypothetical protein [Bacillus sp. CGMCC 1.16541]|uniref:hypothetical protein n=1 Tax=Bacillus sp. CGMCC 1.16541 TaxID=2185143 RepID=UPI000D72CADE|nr:hypothetical protein [Bacillus sp. CGMCC 1.16541]
MAAKKRGRKPKTKTKRQLMKELGLLPEKENKPRVNRRKLVLELQEHSNNQPLKYSAIQDFYNVKSYVLGRLAAKAKGERFLERSITDEELGMVKVILAMYNLHYIQELHKENTTYGHVFEALEAAFDNCKLLEKESVS